MLIPLRTASSEALTATIMDIPNDVKKFIASRIELTNLCLPRNYPDPDGFEKFQAGYRYNAITLENLSGKEGEFKEDWYVICSNYFDDPFCVDFSEHDQNFPVYFFLHGVGSWTPIKAAATLHEFERSLLAIKEIEKTKEVILFLEKNYDLENEFWKEVYLGYKETDFSTPEQPEAADLHEWIKGKVIITNLGKDKWKVIYFLKEKLNLTPQRALALSRQSEIEYKQGFLAQLKHDITCMKALGATAVFRPD